MADDIKYMRRALQLAACGRQGASPNPMVGAVIVSPSGKIIGEGFHRRCGGPHAEVNAVRDVYASYGRDAQQMLRESTIYVTLEPCAHYGKTPPCAKLLIDEGVKQVVVGCVDPFSKVSGRGIAMLREAGAEVSVGVLEKECREINRRFFKAHTYRRPYVTLKWAQSADGYIDGVRGDGEPAYRFSTELGSTLVHRLRSLHDAIAAGSGTYLADKPRMNCRLWPGGHDPIRVAFDRRGRLTSASADVILDCDSVELALAGMYDRGITSVLVEGGAMLLNAFLAAGLWDEIRVEVTPHGLGDAGSVKAPAHPFVAHDGTVAEASGIERVDENIIYRYVC